MAIFNYKARDEEGRIISGRMDVSGEEELQSRLESLGLFLVKFSAEKRSVFQEDISQKILSITPRDFYTVTLQLANTVSTGVPLITSLRSIVESCRSRKLAVTLERVSKDIESGSSFSEALSKHPKVFSKFYTSMVELGESSGSLPKILYTLSEHLKKEMEIQRRIVLAMSYPLILTLIGTGIVIYILAFIMPQFVKIYVDESISLPVPTQILLFLSNLLVKRWSLLVISIIGAIFGYQIMVGNEFGRLWIDKLKLKVPLIGELIRKVCAKRLIDGLYLLYSSGLPILQSLNIVKSTLRNRHFERLVDRLGTHISSGKDLASYVRLDEFFPADIIAMVRSGERSGTMQKMLEKASDIYFEEVNYSIERLISAFEIGVILAVGIGVGFIAMAVLFPIFRLGQGIISK